MRRLATQITTHLCGGYYKFKFAGAQNTVVVVYSCGLAEQEAHAPDAD